MTVFSCGSCQIIMQHGVIQKDLQLPDLLTLWIQPMQWGTHAKSNPDGNVQCTQQSRVQSVHQQSRLQLEGPCTPGSRAAFMHMPRLRPSSCGSVQNAEPHAATAHPDVSHIGPLKLPAE